MTDRPTCETCRWLNDGQCRRYPPQMSPWPNGNQQPIVYEPAITWPMVSATDWCGEWKEMLP